ncbi:MAG: hypothetical protein C4320_07235, partial [Armatimonadota bacterium]
MQRARARRKVADFIASIGSGACPASLKYALPPNSGFRSRNDLASRCDTTGVPLFAPVILPALTAPPLTASPLTASRGSSALPASARVRHEYDLLDSRIQIRIEPGAASMTGTVTHTLRTTRKNAFLLFDAGRLNIRSVRVGGRPTPYRSNRDVLAIATNLPLGRIETVEINYQAKPQAGMYFVPVGRSGPATTPSVYTQGEMEDTRYWLPTYDFPDDKATVEATYDVPAGWSALGNGKLLGVNRGPLRWTWHWKMDQPISTYLTTMLAGPYTEVSDGTFQGKPVSIWVPTGLESWARPTFGGTDKLIAIFSKLTGTNYPFARYTQAVVPDFLFGGMENAS